MINFLLLRREKPFPSDLQAVSDWFVKFLQVSPIKCDETLYTDIIDLIQKITLVYLTCEENLKENIQENIKSRLKCKWTNFSSFFDCPNVTGRGKIQNSLHFVYVFNYKLHSQYQARKIQNTAKIAAKNSELHTNDKTVKNNSGKTKAIDNDDEDGNLRKIAKSDLKSIVKSMRNFRFFYIYS